MLTPLGRHQFGLTERPPRYLNDVVLVGRPIAVCSPDQEAALIRDTSARLIASSSAISMIQMPRICCAASL